MLRLLEGLNNIVGFKRRESDADALERLRVEYEEHCEFTEAYRRIFDVFI